MNELPKYIPPPEYEKLYHDFMTDKSLDWLNVAPKQWRQYINLQNSFERYKEFCECNPDVTETFEEWLANSGNERFLLWSVKNFYLEKKMK
ncbi:hypothetical protein [Nostoc sp. CCY0012]|uniref:hypothetical protein n=1 Tax=Nostoc sp. CCY0012 TaxID=1056123 RepID=UPI0039C69748